MIMLSGRFTLKGKKYVFYIIYHLMASVRVEYYGAFFGVPHFSGLLTQIVDTVRRFTILIMSPVTVIIVKNSHLALCN